MKTKKWVFLLLLFTIGFTVSAEERTVYGTITDDKKEPVIGASVTIKGSKQGAVSDLNGRYTIQASTNETLVVSYIGYQSVEVKITNQPVINVVLEEMATQLTEAVVIGYGAVKRKDVTGAVSKVNMEDVLTSPVATIDQALSGRIAGVSIVAADGAPGSQAQITIRGGSLSQDASPLFVIDGFPMENFDMATLDSKNIESIDILKDASSIAIYGSRGANGVIIVNTKQGVMGKPKVT